MTLLLWLLAMFLLGLGMMGLCYLFMMGCDRV
jgi:hypothetical protein